MCKYKPGDRVIVVHREDTPAYFSYTLEGSVGRIAEAQEYMNPQNHIYRLDNYEYVAPDRVAQDRADIREDVLTRYAQGAWYAEYCLDPFTGPCGSQEAVSDEDFDAIFE